MRDRKRVEDGLAKIASLFGLSGKDGWKAAAYERGAEIVRALGDGQLEAMIAADRLRDIDGIGPSLAENRSVELLARRALGAARSARSRVPTGRRRTGPRARDDGAAYPARWRTRSASLQSRSCAARARHSACARCPESASSSSRSWARPIEQIDAPPVHRRMLLVEAIATANRLRERLVSIASVAEEVQLAGAARRGEESVDELRTAGTGLLTATGPRAHVQALEERARARGIALQDVIADEPGAVAAEAAIYRALDLEVTPPELRVDGGEAELSERDESRFTALVEAEHIRGLVHCHTEYSDGRDDVEAMARAAEGAGHGVHHDHRPFSERGTMPAAFPLDRLKQQWDEIARVQELVNVRILRGTESDILADGNLDYPDSILERFDVVIASVHSRFTSSIRRAMTQRLVHAMELPIFKIWGHGAGTAAAVARSDPLRRAARARRACGEPGCCRDQREILTAESRAQINPPRPRTRHPVRDFGRCALDPRPLCPTLRRHDGPAWSGRTQRSAEHLAGCRVCRPSQTGLSKDVRVHRGRGPKRG